MQQLLESRGFQYALVFVTAGSLAVAIRYVSEQGETRIAGIIAMVPMKILITWALVGYGHGERGIVESTTGMFWGMGALLSCILAVRWLAPHVGFGWTIPLALVVWTAAVLAIENWLRPALTGS